jgi:hypothetical protein
MGVPGSWSFVLRAEAGNPEGIKATRPNKHIDAFQNL